MLLAFADARALEKATVGGDAWEDVVEQCRERCTQITQEGGVIIDVDMVASVSNPPHSAETGQLLTCDAGAFRRLNGRS